jgi:chromate reductase, NAD(P)H dehydrogenase (quinone)
VRILAISGSLRAASSNTSALAAIAVIAPPGIEVALYDGLATLPHFNPDLDVDAPPEPVRRLRQEIGTCDGLLISSPEYAHGVAGSLKNALDWLVSSVELPGKPVAIINASPRAIHADTQLREILTTMSARVVERACISLPLLGRSLDAAAIAADPDLSATLLGVLESLSQAVAAVA